MSKHILFLMAAAVLIAAPWQCAEVAAQTRQAEQGKLEAASSERPSKKMREYEKLRQEALKAYHHHKDHSFKESVDEAWRQKQREHGEYALAINLGDASAPQVTRVKDKVKVEAALYDHSLAQDYVNRLGQSLIPKESKRLYAFRVIFSPFPEARSLSTGTVYVSTGLLAMVENEAQLAYILGHEIAHVEKNHWFDDVLIAELVDKKKGRRKKIANTLEYTVSTIADPVEDWTGMTEAALKFASRYALPSLLKLFSPKILTAWDKIHEDEADKLALRYMLDRSYDPREIKSFYANLYDAAQEEAKLRFGFTAAEQRIVERALAVDSEVAAMSATLSARTVSSGAVNLATLKQKNPELAARRQAAQKQLAWFISGSAGPGKHFSPAGADAPAITPALEREIKQRLAQGDLIADAPEFNSLMAVIKRDNGIRAFQSDLFRIARANLAEALLLREDDSLAHYYNGRVWMQTARAPADKAAAIEAFRRAVKLDTTRTLPEARLHLALALMHGGGSSKASNSFNSPGKQEITALFNDYVALYKSRHEGRLPPELKTIREYLRDPDARERSAQSTTPAVNPAPKKSRH